MQTRRGRLFLLVVFFSATLAFLTNCKVFAEDEMSIEILPNPVEMELLPGQIGEESQTITAYTSNAAGYTIRFRTAGQSSALINTDDDSYTIPTFSLPSGEESIPADELTDGYGYSIDNGENFLPVPEPSLHATTLFKTTTAGGNTHDLTFEAKIPMNTAAGVYENTFIIEIVANLEPCAQQSICYLEMVMTEPVRWKTKRR